MIDLLFCGNSYVFDGVLTCMLSILKRSKKDTYHVHLFTMDLTRMKESYTPIDDKSVNALRSVLKEADERNEVTVYDVTTLYEEEFHKCVNEGCYCSPYTLLRLLADRVEGMPKKLLYLDCDILFNQDIHLLYDQDISEVEYAAASDHYGKYLIHPGYINAGVLLFNMEKVKENDLFTKARALLREKKLVFADQSALIRSTTKRKHLPQKFNDQKFLHRHTVVRHFSKRLFWLPYPHTDNIKQWQVEKVHRIFHYHQFDDIYTEYFRIKESLKGGINHD